MSLSTPHIGRRIAGVTTALALTAGLGLAAITLPSSASPVGAPDALKRSALGPNLIKNSGFKNGFHNWAKSTQNAGALHIVKGGVWGSEQAAAMHTRKTTTASLRDERTTAPKSVKGRKYQASAWVRTTGHPIHGTFELLEWKDNEVAARSGDKFVAHKQHWSRVTFVAQATEDNSALQVSLTAVGVSDTSTFKVDRVKLHPIKGPKPHKTPQADPSGSSSAAPTPSDTPTPSPTSSSPTPTTSATATPTATATQTANPYNNTTLYGASVWTDGRTWAQAVDDSNAKYNGMEVVRVFYPGLPGAWPGQAGDVGGPVVVSFKANPADILSGKYDSYLANWFRSMPLHRDIWWTYWHEPEDDVANGNFTSQQWRDAYRRIAGLADAANHPRLYNTVILMCWTLDPRSGRNFDNFFPGSDVVEALGWDCYSVPSSTRAYATPSDMYGRALQKTRQLGLMFGIAETGSLLAPSDPTGVQRGDWLRTIGHYLGRNDADFVCYFDSVVGGDFRLKDDPSAAGWRDVVSTFGRHDPLP